MIPMAPLGRVGGIETKAVAAAKSGFNVMLVPVGQTPVVVPTGLSVVGVMDRPEGWYDCLCPASDGLLPRRDVNNRRSMCVRRRVKVLLEHRAMEPRCPPKGRRPTSRGVGDFEGACGQVRSETDSCIANWLTKLTERLPSSGLSRGRLRSSG